MGNSNKCMIDRFYSFFKVFFIHANNNIQFAGALIDHTNIDIATLTLPKAGAEAIAPVLVKGGVKAIWNFAHTDLDLPPDVVVENVHLSESLMQLSYNINRKNRK